MRGVEGQEQNQQIRIGRARSNSLFKQFSQTMTVYNKAILAENPLKMVAIDVIMITNVNSSKRSG